MGNAGEPGWVREGLNNSIEVGDNSATRWG